jgi:hypothetical protein
VARGALIGQFWASFPAAQAVSLSGLVDLVALLEMSGKRGWWCDEDVSPVPSRYRSTMPGGVVRVVGVLPVMAVLACFPAVGRCADNGLQDVV